MTLTLFSKKLFMYAGHWNAYIRNHMVYVLIICFLLFIAPLVEADKEADEQHYLLWRIERGVPEGSTEIPKCMLLTLHAYSFQSNHGCRFYLFRIVS